VLRLRQAVLVAADLAPAVAALRAELGAGEPYADPGVGLFGLENGVLPLGDQFLEVVSPTEEGTAAGRALERRGPGGYMLIFQVEDIAAARARAVAEGVRVVWEIALEDMETVHLHPRDMGVIVSLDRPVPAGAWRWAGPEWTGGVPGGPSASPGRILGARIEVPDPEAAAARWATVLGVPEVESIAFVAGDRGLVEVVVEAPGEVRRGRDRVEVGGLLFTFSD
jgi:hypothetical protein